MCTGVLVGGVDREKLCRQLREIGLTVIDCVATADQLLSQAEKVLPEVVVLNIVLGDYDDLVTRVLEGQGAVWRLKHLSKPPYIVVVACEAFVPEALFTTPDKVIQMPERYALLSGMFKDALAGKVAIAA